jgi:hypothetical protein
MSSKIEVDVEQILCILDEHLKNVLRRFLFDYIFGDANGYAQLDGTYAIFNYKVEELNKFIFDEGSALGIVRRYSEELLQKVVEEMGG